MEKKKKTTSTYKGRGFGKGDKVPGSKKRFIREEGEPDRDAMFIRKKKARKDPELAPPPQDIAAAHKYPPPKVDPVFRDKWMKLIDNIVARENFNPAHLDSLEILCDLHVQYGELTAFIRKKGRTYESVGRNGRQFKFYPEVMQLTQVQRQIKEYSKMLGLLLSKDKGGLGNTDKDWE